MTMRRPCIALLLLVSCADAPEPPWRFGAWSHKCAAGTAAQAPLGLGRGYETVCFARAVERSGSGLRTPFGALVLTPDAVSIGAHGAAYSDPQEFELKCFRTACAGVPGSRLNVSSDLENSRASKGLDDSRGGGAGPATRQTSRMPSLRRVAKCSDIVRIDTGEGLTFGGQTPSARLITSAPAPRREE